MPAGSESAPSAPVSLPHTWHPHGARIAVYVAGTALVVVCAVVWVGLGDRIRATFTPLERVTLVLVALLLFAAWWGLVRSRVVATEQGLRVVNFYRSRQFEWSQVIAVSLRRGAPWATLDLSDGSTLAMLGIQGSDGERAALAVRQLRVVLNARTPGPGGPAS